MLTEKKEERPSNTSTGSSAPPLCLSPRAVFVGFLAPESLISKQTTAKETRDRHMTRTHKFTREHLRVLTRIRSRKGGLRAREHTHTHTGTHKEAVLHNK